MTPGGSRRLGLAASLLSAAWLARPSEAASLPRLVARIPLPGVEGRLDHLALDPERSRLFVAALGNDSVEVIDLAREARVQGIGGLREPQGVLFLPERRRLYVTVGGAAALAVVSGSDLASAGRIATREDPDNLRYDPGAGRIWVGAGTGPRAALSAFDPGDAGLRSEIALDGHPESFQLEAGRPRIFVNVPSATEVEVVDRERARVSARWKLPCAANFPMALDEQDARLFVGCRRPARLLVLETESGRVVAEVESPADADDLFLDRAAGRLYLSSGAGIVRTYLRRGRDRLEIAGDVTTGPGARTSLFDAGSHRLYVAVPRRGGAPAEIQVFDTTE